MIMKKCIRGGLFAALITKVIQLAIYLIIITIMTSFPLPNFWLYFYLPTILIFVVIVPVKGIITGVLLSYLLPRHFGHDLVKGLVIAIIFFPLEGFFRYVVMIFEYPNIVFKLGFLMFIFYSLIIMFVYTYFSIIDLSMGHWWGLIGILPLIFDIFLFGYLLIRFGTPLDLIGEIEEEHIVPESVY